ncbi:hypothetical protein AMIS_7870 [Actinoplanes missouriensis 431]|uniref:Uncharacterized protein n=1 Tax=Actinoplanes missouriensis (strain ATCC 14538 / DSM 43046 / CBS 188.64 / JCM 3121 / NBRC 102363 / NCIMB 12654 / NRRL B-3342 / UNCC 431) TaxID=512565 RepID=I0GZ20_ACTM4|nr:hypothetical protein [Actinoplanes missouriensis]BAL86007.1 hypothetical protein AMIS_7870 [Actinoplanes missouriensis 431]
MDKPERRTVSLAKSLNGLRLIGAGAVLGLALAVPASPAAADPPRPQPGPVAEHDAGEE